jgi:hypothetical protein
MTTLRTRIYSMVLDEGQPSRLIWAIPRGKILPRKGGPTWDLDASETDPTSLRFRWEDVVDSLRRWLAVYQPPIIVDHGRTESGIPRSHGLVTGLVEVSAELAESLGVKQVGDAIYLSCEPNAELAEALERGDVPYASPGLSANYRDEDPDSEVWPIIVKELSLTLDPRQKKRQFPIASTAALSAALLSEEADDMADEMESENEGAAMDVAETLKALAEGMLKITERLDKLEASMMEEPPPAEEPDAAELSEASEVGKLRKRIAELETAAKTATSTAAVDAMLSERELAADARDPLIKLHMIDPTAAAAIAKSAPKRGTSLKRAPAVGAPSLSAALSESSTREDVAKHLRSTGEAKTATEAWEMACKIVN